MLPNYQKETPEQFKEQLMAFTSTYFSLKDALVATDANKAGLAAKQSLSLIEQVDGNLLSGAASVYWAKRYDALSKHIEKIITLDDVEKQRKQFGTVSSTLIETIEVFGVIGSSVYVQHCPMAFQNKGGDWLATEEAIQNPYFGDKMMKCGVVKKVFEN